MAHFWTFHLTSSNACQTSMSEWFANGSKFLLILPANKIGS